MLDAFNVVEGEGQVRDFSVLSPGKPQMMSVASCKSGHVASSVSATCCDGGGQG
jgi:hypothetical protein